jgi:hypothetical protein
MVSNLWNLERSSIPESMECSGTALIFTLTKYTQPWQRINAVEEITLQCGFDPFVEILDVPKNGILGEDIRESDRKPHPNLLFRALAIQAFGKVRDLHLNSDIVAGIGDFSKNLLTVLEQEARSGATPLIRWSAAVTIKSIGLDRESPREGNDSSGFLKINAPEIELKIPREGNDSSGFLKINVSEIEQKITEQQIKRLVGNRQITKDSKSKHGIPDENENSLDFWVYGPSWLLFSLPINCEEYLFWLDRVFAAIAVTRFQYGLNAENNPTVINFLEIAKNNFNDLDFSKILAKVFEFIQHPEAKVKDRAAILLEPYKDKLDRRSAQIMMALAYKFNLVESQPLESLTITEIENYKGSLDRSKIEIEGVYSEALSLCGDRDTELANFLSTKQQEYQNTVDEQINNLSKLIKSIVDCQSLLDANRELLYLTVQRLQEWDYMLGNKLTAHQKKLETLSVDKNTCQECMNLEEELNSIKDSLQYNLYEITSRINSKIRELELSASKNNKNAADMFKWTWGLLGVWFSVGLLLYLSDSVINSIFTVSYQTEFLVYWTIFFIVMVVFLLMLAILFSAIAALEKRKESKLIPKFDSLSQIANNFSMMWQKSYLQQFVPSVRSHQ